MERNQSADLLSIFSFIFAGIQGLAVLFIGLYSLMMFAVLVMGAGNSRGGNAETLIVPVVVTALFTFMGGIGLTIVILNIKLGRALRGRHRPTQKRVIVTSIFNICS